MLELLLAQTLLDLACCEAMAREGRRVAAIRLRVGELSGVEPRALQAAFEARQARTACASAELTIVPVPAQWTCAECGREQPADAAGHCTIGFCVGCDSDRIILTAGMEIDLEHVEFAPPPPATESPAEFRPLPLAARASGEIAAAPPASW